MLGNFPGGKKIVRISAIFFIYIDTTFQMTFRKNLKRGNCWLFFSLAAAEVVPVDHDVEYDERDDGQEEVHQVVHPDDVYADVPVVLPAISRPDESRCFALYISIKYTYKSIYQYIEMVSIIFSKNDCISLCKANERSIYVISSYSSRHRLL